MNKKSELQLEKVNAFIELLQAFHNSCVNSYVDKKYIDAVVKYDFAVVTPRVGGIQVIDRTGLNFYETSGGDEEVKLTLGRGNKTFQVSSYRKKSCWLCMDRKVHSFTVLEPAFVGGKWQKERGSFGVGFIIERW